MKVANRSDLALSRRDNRTQPGVLTPGTDKKIFRPHKALRTRRRRPRPRIRSRGVMEYWNVGVLRQARIASRVRGVGIAEGAVRTGSPQCVELSVPNRRSQLPYAPSGLVVVWAGFLGLKPQAESCYPFGIGSTRAYWAKCVRPDVDLNLRPLSQDRESE
jgi:hypothetical protein